MVDGEAHIGVVLEWGIAEAIHPEERISGDAHIICRAGDGLLIAVADGLGHGEEAAAAATLATATVEAHAGEPPGAIVERCHRILSGTRGVVMALARIEPAPLTVTWLCVGNVQGAIVRAVASEEGRTEPLLARSGVIGLRLPTLITDVHALLPGDALVLATDGVHPGFLDHAHPMSPGPLAQRIIETHRRGIDDALVVIGRVRGEARR